MEKKDTRKALESSSNRKPFEKPSLRAYRQGTLRARTAQGGQKPDGIAPINPLGLEMGGS